MNKNLADEMFCLINKIESVSSKNVANEYLKNENKIDPKFMKAFCDFMDKEVSPWIDDLTKGNEVDEIKNNILTDKSKIKSYLYSFDIYSDAYLEIIFDELKKHYENNSIKYDEDEVYQKFLEDISNKSINLEIFNQDIRKLINIVFMIDDIQEKCVNLMNKPIS